jgi:hypothetical protein
VRGEGPDRVGDLRELGTVQRAVGDHPEHAARRQHLADLGRRAAQPTERSVPTVADPAYRPADAVPAWLGGPGVGDLQQGDRRSLGVGQDQPALHRVVQVESADHLGRNLEGDRHGPGGGVGEPTPAGHRGQVGAAQETGQRGVRPGEEQLQIGQLVRAGRVRRSVTQQLVGQHPPVAHRTPKYQPAHSFAAGRRLVETATSVARPCPRRVPAGDHVRLPNPIEHGRPRCTHRAW